MAANPHDCSCPEKQLLACCSRARVPAHIASEIQRLLELPLDWNYLLTEAASNSISPLLLRHLSAFAAERIPPVHFAALKEHVRAACVRSLSLTGELIHVLRALSAAGVQAIPYKGPVLAAQAYGDIALREFEDIDLVVRQRDVAAADEALVRIGFSREFPPIFAPGGSSPVIPGEYNYRERERGILLELHTERTLRHFPATPDLDNVARRLAIVALGGQEIHTFRPEDTLVFLCVHGCKDFWERLVWVADVAELAAAHAQLDWDGVYAFADSLGARRILHIGLALADRLLGVSLADTIRARIRGDATAGAIAGQMGERLLSRAPEPLSARASFNYRRRMLPGACDGLRYAMRLTTGPAAEDWQAIRLPKPLAPLYAALRPFRLLRKYGAS